MKCINDTYRLHSMKCINDTYRLHSMIHSSTLTWYVINVNVITAIHSVSKIIVLNAGNIPPSCLTPGENQAKFSKLIFQEIIKHDRTF